jgi:hypothetical protein
MGRKTKGVMMMMMMMMLMMRGQQLQQSCAVGELYYYYCGANGRSSSFYPVDQNSPSLPPSLSPERLFHALHFPA